MSGCERWEQMISALLDGELSPEEETELRAHMAACPDCAAMYEAFAAVGAAVRAQDVPDTLHVQIMETVHAAQKASRTQSKIVRLRPILAAAACLIFVVGTVFALKNTVGFGRSAMKSERADATMEAPMAPGSNATFAAGKTGGASAAAAPDMAMAEDTGILESKAEAAGVPTEGTSVFNAAADSPEAPKEAESARGEAEPAEADSQNMAAAVIAVSELIVRAEKLGETPYADSDRFVLSEVRVEEVLQNAGGIEVAEGCAIHVLESRWNGDEAGMKAGKQYLLCLEYDPANDRFIPVGMPYGVIPLDPEEPAAVGAAGDADAVMEALRQYFSPQP